jgi:methyl-accepting chemotaxis protein
MEVNARRGVATATHLNLLMLLGLLAPAAAVLGLGIWLIHQSGAGNSSAPDAELLLWSVTFGVAVAAVVLTAFAWLRTRAVVRNRALELADLCRQISGGDRSLRAPVVGDDECAVLATAVNAVLERAPVTALGRGGDAQDAATLQGQIEKLLQEVSAVGDGDLRVQAEVTPDTLGVLADSFNYMIEELAKVVGRVQATTFQVTNATRRLLDRSAEVAQATEVQSAQISQTTDSVARLADFVQLSANNALAAVNAAREALRNAEGGQQAVVQTIDGMVHIRENVQETSKKIKRLGERSQEVGEIVRLIEDIADQTNLLALNAAIQSAMAGEHGRGFAVVADEIRLLAERVTEATKRIAAIVKTIQGDTFEAVVAMEESTQEVVNGSRLADEAGESLRSIYAAVERQTQMIESIARAANDHAQTSEAVASAVSRIAEIARQTNTATQDTTAAVSYLAELAEQLRASVATFRLPEQAVQAPSLLAQPDGRYPSTLDLGALPNLGMTPWGDDGSAIPALPAAPLGAMSQLPYGGMSAGGLDFNGFDRFFSGQSGGDSTLAPGYGEQQYGQEPQAEPPPFPGDLY